MVAARRAAFICGFLLCICGLAADKRITIQDALAIKNVASPVFSADGKWIAYTVSEWDKEKNRRVAHIWLVPSDGGSARRLTNGDKGESAPDWSPAGTRLAFLADREKGNQVWIIDSTGGEADKLTSGENPVTGFCWSPDGARIAYITRDVPKDKADREKKTKDKDDAIVVERGFLYSHLWVIDVAARKTTRLTEGDFSVSAPQWSPDSQWIAYVRSSSGSHESSYADISEDRNTDIYVVAAGGGVPRQLTANPGPDSSPRWSPDSREIAYVSRADPQSWAEKNDIVVIPSAGGAPRNLTRDFGESAGAGLAWSPDGKALYFSSPVGADAHVFRVPAAGGRPTAILQGRQTYGDFDVAGQAGKIAYLVGDARRLPDVWTAPLAGGSPRQLTHANPQAEEFAIADTEVLRWKGPGNLNVEGVLIKPLGYEPGKRYPMILQIHGGPYGRFSAAFNSRAQIFAARGYAVLMPNPRGSTGYGNPFTLANLGDWGGKDFQDIMAGVDDAVARGIADPDKLVVMGGSYGGFMTFWTITQTDRFKAAIGHAGISDWYSFHGQSDIPGLMEFGFTGQPWAAAEIYRKFSPMSHVARVKTPLLITHGEQDRRVPIAQAEQYYRALKKRGVDVVFVRYPREGHGIQEPNHQIELVARQLEWFDSHLGIERPKN